MILLKAEELHNQPGTSEFDGGERWLSRFMERHNLFLRRKTTACQKPPAEYVRKIVNFIRFMPKQRLATHYDSGFIIACDETALWLDCVSGTTVETKGAECIFFV